MASCEELLDASLETREERDASRVSCMQNVALIKARGVAPKEGRMWTTKAEESDFGGAIVGNAKHTRSYLICMHIVTALALALSSRSACIDGDAHAPPFAGERRGVRGWCGSDPAGPSAYLRKGR